MNAPRARAGFTLVELITVMTIIAMLTIVVLAGVRAAERSARKAGSTSNLRQFGAATHLYLADHDGTFFPYRQTVADRSIIWWFGHEAAVGAAQREGEREIDRTRSPLYPYLQQGGGVEVCPGFLTDQTIWKPKYRGASYGYGYNVHLGGNWLGLAPLARMSGLEHPANTILFATCAQVNTFQAPASPDNPLVEEFFGIDHIFKTIHFRFGEKALVLFVDGHVQEMERYPGTEDTRLPKTAIGRLSPVGSMEMLR